MFLSYVLDTPKRLGTFHRAIDVSSLKVIRQFSVVYRDDIMIFSKTQNNKSNKFAKLFPIYKDPLNHYNSVNVSFPTIKLITERTSFFLDDSNLCRTQRKPSKALKDPLAVQNWSDS